MRLAVRVKSVRKGSKERDTLFEDPVVDLLCVVNCRISGVSPNADMLAAISLDLDRPATAQKVLLHQPRKHAVFNVGIDRVSKNPWREELEAPTQKSVHRWLDPNTDPDVVGTCGIGQLPRRCRGRAV